MSDQYALASLIGTYFEDKLVCAALFGSRARQENHQAADYDLIVVTSTPIHPDKKRTFYNMLDNFCTVVGCDFDREYPAEIVYREDLYMSLSGYGFVKKSNEILIPQISSDEWTAFNAYRQWLSAFSSPSQFLVGDLESYHTFVQRAQRCTASIVLTNFKRRWFTLDDFSVQLIGSGKQFLGFPDTPATQSYIKDVYWPLIHSLVEKGIIEEKGVTFKVVQPKALKLPDLKEHAQCILEQQYIGVHESVRSWHEYLCNIGATGLLISQTDQPLIYKTDSELKPLIDLSLPEEGVPFNAFLFELMSLMNKYSINQGSVNYIAFPDAGNSKAAIAAAMLTPLWNQNLIAVDKSAPIGTFIEIKVITWLRQLVGYKCEDVMSAENVGGVATTGGVMANTIGLLMARSKVFPESRKSGLAQVRQKPYLLIADKTLEHYSHKAAFWWLGLGEDNVIPVKANGYNFDIPDLRQKLKEYNSEGCKVVAVICLAGDSRTTTIQNIREIYAETSKHDIWLHVDACHGGIALFSSKKDLLCQDYRLADSISIDPHKGLAIPYSSSFCLFKDQHALHRLAKSTDITITLGSYDLGQITPFLGSRPFDTLKLWSLIKYHGIKGLRENVDYRISLSKKWAEYLNNSHYFISLNDPELTAISFSIHPQKLHISDSYTLSFLNKELHDRCYKQGWLIIHSFDLIDFENRLGLSETRPLRVLGSNFGNVMLDESHFPKIVAYLEGQLMDILSNNIKG